LLGFSYAVPTEDVAREYEFMVLWHQHGGSGLSMTRDDYLGLDVAHRDWLVERINAERKAEAKAINGK